MLELVVKVLLAVVFVAIVLMLAFICVGIIGMAIEEDKQRKDKKE